MKTMDWPLISLPRIRLCGRFPLADRGFSPLYQMRFHALHLHEYACEMRHDDMVIAIEPGDVTISPAELPSAYNLQAPGFHWCVHFTMRLYEDGEAIALPLHCRAGSITASVRERMAHISALFAQGNEKASCAARAELALQQLLLWLGSVTSPDRKPSHGAERVWEIINARFHEPMTIPEIAREVGMSHAHLARSFRKLFGLSISQRLIERRIEHARFLLESTDLPIWRVAERSGIPDAHYFNKQVRRWLGASPSVVRLGGLRTMVIDPDR